MIYYYSSDMKLEDVKYDRDNHFYYEILEKGDRAYFQSYIDRFMLHKQHGFIWVDLFNRLGQCSELPKEWAKKREQLFGFLGHACMRRIVNKYAITDADREIANRAMRTFRSEFCELVRPEASFSVRCRYALGFTAY